MILVLIIKFLKRLCLNSNIQLILIQQLSMMLILLDLLSIKKVSKEKVIKNISLDGLLLAKIKIIKIQKENKLKELIVLMLFVYILLIGFWDLHSLKNNNHSLYFQNKNHKKHKLLYMTTV